ncbi:GTP-binding protein [Methylobacillus gramineus]|uniref:CobW family GTP-binding protein n=1 Tax=Methylobacillus gramineus TaxID=755169 RepID=UPI001CFFA94B|nr:GTP-binding protein [Methylobacillus gramineus]MCB5184070.1 GTP-binding protein [Methylobacillus gramineus]
MQKADSHFIPVTLLTGFLGSGKTTLLNRWLQQPEMADTLVIINEFGQVGLDHLLVAHQPDSTTVVELNNGCLCCNLRTDLKQTLKDISWRFSRHGQRQFKRVVIETSGLADPAPILHTIMSDAYVSAYYRLDSIVTVVDSVHVLETLEQFPQALKQVAVADVLLLTKVDLVNAGVQHAVESRLRGLNPSARLHQVQGSSTSMDWIFSGQDADGRFPHWLPAQAQAPMSEHQQQSISTISEQLDLPIDSDVFAAWQDALRGFAGPGLLRFKGLFHLVGQSQPVALHAVQHVMHAPVLLNSWPESMAPQSRLVFITQDIAEQDIFALLQKLH